MSISGTLAFSIYVDWFNANGKPRHLARIGPIMPICLNLPPNEILKPESVYVAGTIPGQKQPTSLQLIYLLMPLVKELKELGQGYHFLPVSTGASEFLSVLQFSWPSVMLLPCASLWDLFLIQEATFSIFSLFTRLKLKKLVLNFTTHTHTKIINQPLLNGFGKRQNNKQFSLSMEYNIQLWKTFCIGM
ncbi:hypothetical protein O181_002371 [Austropuccinia psidii MF-1]|uniref:Uncharacterized protein n=1 Tax=Austropuccinia psidii MF-1 TaxID=1389203 RepID=A0A9Q3GD82_9BASI|nr:hypothetical protein [Austropuccinia psidii MF-1]